MARKIKTEKAKKKFVIKLIFTIVILALVGVGGFFGYKHFFGEKKTAQENKVVDEIKEFEYTLRERDSKYFKSEYAELKKILTAKEIDKKAYATQLAKMFVIDLYTMNTKVNKYDIGGIQFVYPEKKEMHSQKVIDSIYQTMLDDTYGDRKQELPEVKEVKVISTEETKYKYGKQELDAYLVKMEISYVKDLKYDTQASVIVIRENFDKEATDNDKLCVADFQPTLNPKY